MTMWLWHAWFNSNSFYSYCVVVPFISAIMVYANLKEGKSLKSLWFPLGFLIFMFPLPQIVTDPLSHHLKYLAASISTGMLNVMQIPSIQNGNVVVMPNGSLVVNDACSGIRAMISLLAMGSVFAYYMEGHWSRKVVLLLLVLPIAILTNSLRITFLGLVTHWWGAVYTVGVVHDCAGFLIYGLAFIFLYLISSQLSLRAN